MNEIIFILFVVALIAGEKIIKAMLKTPKSAQPPHPDAGNNQPGDKEIVLPEPWRHMTLPPLAEEKPRDTTPPPVPRQRKKKELQPQHIKTEPYMEQPIRTTVDKQQPLTMPAEPTTAEDYGIHSVEDARRAIIWGEIMNRKY